MKKEIKLLHDQGKKIKEIAEELKISVTTVRYHLFDRYKNNIIAHRKNKFKLMSDEERKKYNESRREYNKKYQKERYEKDKEFRENKKKIARERRKEELKV